MSSRLLLLFRSRNSEGVLPFGIYTSGQGWTDAASFSTLVDTWQNIGFTHVFTGWFDGGALANQDTELSVADAKKLNVAYTCTVDLNNSVSATDIAAYAAAHPSISYWSIRDEPSTALQISADTTDLTELRAAGTVPAGDTFGVYIGGSIPAQQALAKSFNPDVLVIDNYPISTNNATGYFVSSGFHATFSEAQRIMLTDSTTGREWRGTNTPLWAILQAHDYTGLRSPTVVEMQRMAWEALGAGANGLFWFVWQFTDSNNFTVAGIGASQAKQDALQALATRLKPLGHLFLHTHSQTSPTYATGNGWVYALHTDDNKDILIVVNRDCSNSSTTSLASGGPYTDIETGAVVNSGDTFSLEAGSARLFYYTQPDLTSGKLVWDTFTDASGTALASHTPEVGESWTVVAGTPEIQQGHAAQRTTGNTLASINPGVANVTVQATIAATSGGHAYIACRIQDTSNMVRCGIANTGVVHFDKIIAGSQTSLLSVTAPTAQSDVPHTFSLSISGNVITCKMDGTQIGSATVTNLAAQTAVGMFFASNTNSRISNFSAKAT